MAEGIGPHRVLIRAGRSNTDLKHRDHQPSRQKREDCAHVFNKIIVRRSGTYGTAAGLVIPIIIHTEAQAELLWKRIERSTDYVQLKWLQEEQPCHFERTPRTWHPSAVVELAAAGKSEFNHQFERLVLRFLEAAQIREQVHALRLHDQKQFATPSEAPADVVCMDTGC